MFNYINSNRKKGNTLISTLVALFFLLVFVFVLILQLKPLTIYSNLKEVGRLAILRMETDGGITFDTRAMIKSTLDFESYNQDNLTIEPNIDVTSSTIPDYGSKITLDLTYDYHYKSYSMIHLFDIEAIDKVMNISVHISTTSKKAK